MTKREWRVKLKQLRKEGYLTHSMLLELYKEDEEIPKWFGNLLYSEFKEPKPIIMECGIKTYDLLNKIFKDELDRRK